MDATDFENMMSLDNSVKASSVMSRWERRAARQAAADNAGSGADRYIPNRSGMDFDSLQSEENVQHSDNELHKLIATNISEDLSSSRVLSYKQKAPAPADGHQSSLRVLYSAQGATKKEVVKPTRHIASAPLRVLDAPDLMDDYYLNLLSWGSNNYLAVALTKTVYLWNAATGDIKELMNVESEEDNYISSVSFIPNSGSHIAIGTANNTVQLWDVQAGRQLRSLRGHAARVGALSWNNHILSSGSKDNTVLHHDVRIQNNVIGKMACHTQEVCGLAWSPDGTYLASGANDNTLMIQEFSAIQNMNITPKHILTEHQAAVKALAWSPHERNLLASGGGTADRCIKFWNASSGALMNSIDTGSQVCALQWSPMEKEILSR
jgi:cell division cycle protein 20 (cofactor of APC complex)